MSRARSLLMYAGALLLIAAAFFFVIRTQPQPNTPSEPQANASSSMQTAAAALPTPTVATSTPVAHQSAKSSVAKVSAEQPAASDEIERIQDPYSSPPESTDVVNEQTRASLVNILCLPNGNGLLPISGSGVIIDPRGVILTNAHVAQYVLLSESTQIKISCVIRTGAPATAHYTAQVLYIPPIWVEGHVADITNVHPTGTGEHDYALLLITGTTDGSPLPTSFPALPYDTREAIGFTGDQVLVASYPAEFLGSYAAEYDLYPDSSITTIGQMLTFDTDTVDLISLGGIIEAQSGSSGGAVVNGWGKLVGIVTTTSNGTTTAERDLRALTLSYIDSDIKMQSQLGLADILQGDLAAKVSAFATLLAPSLIGLYLTQLAQ